MMQTKVMQFFRFQLPRTGQNRFISQSNYLFYLYDLRIPSFTSPVREAQGISRYILNSSQYFLGSTLVLTKEYSSTFRGVLQYFKGSTELTAYHRLSFCNCLNSSGLADKKGRDHSNENERSLPF